MRISADKADPAYVSPTLTRGCVIKVDGRTVTEVLTADDERGEVLRYVTDEEGRPIVDGEEFRMEVLRGRVEILCYPPS